jgi:hypothetical protein
VLYVESQEATKQQANVKTSAYPSGKW